MSHLYRFPSGRSVARIRQDLRNESEIEVCSRHGVPLPLEYALEYVRERERLALLPALKDPGTQSPEWIPPAGHVSWIVGTPHHGVFQSTAMLATLAAAITKPARFGFCEFHLNNDEFMGPHRYGRLVQSLQEKGSPHAAAAAELMPSFNASVAGWQRIRKVWGTTAPVMAVKIPKFFKSREPALLTVLKPRKDMMRQVALQVRQGHRVIIGDSDVASISDLAACPHFGIDPKYNGHIQLRALLGATHYIGEQRVLDAGDDGQIVLRRGVQLTADERAAFANDQRSLRSTMAAVMERLPTWQQTAEAAIAQGRISTGIAAQATAATLPWDTFSRKATLGEASQQQQPSKKAGSTLGMS